MGKIEVSALIKAIQESVSLLVSDGIAPRERITDPVNDAARVQDLESGYSTEIDDIVDNIPDVPPTPPVPTLPTVELINGSYGEWSGTKITVANGNSTSDLYLFDGSEFHGDRITYDSGKRYAFYKYSNGSSSHNPNGIFTVSWNAVDIETRYLSAKNISGSSQYFYSAKVARCDSENAIVVTVYNSQNEAFNAFKYTINGTDYYYVLDEVQNDWTDDLSSIGYSIEPTKFYAYPQSGGEAGLANVRWSRNSTYTVYDSDGNVMSLNPGYTIMAVYWLHNNTLEKYGDEYAFKFAFSYSDSYLKAYQANSSAYDVAKIEYKDLPTEKAYLAQYSHSSNWSFPYNTNTLLYADDGSYIPYDTSKRYVMSCASKADGTLVNAKLTPVNMDGYLGYRVSTTAQACYIYYTIS